MEYPFLNENTLDSRCYLKSTVLNAITAHLTDNVEILVHLRVKLYQVRYSRETLHSWYTDGEGVIAT